MGFRGFYNPMCNNKLFLLFMSLANVQIYTHVHI